MTQAQEPTVQSVRSHDFEEMRESFQGWDHEYDQIGAGAFSGIVSHFCSGDLQVIRNFWGNKIRYRGTSPMGSFGTGLTLRQVGSGKWLGNETGPDDVVIQRPGNAAEFLAPREWDALVLSMPEATMDRYFAAFSGEPIRASEILHGAVRMNPDDANELRGMARALFASIDDKTGAHDPTGTDPKTLQFMLEQIASRYALALVNGGKNHITPPTQTKADKLVGRVEEYVRQTPGRAVGILEICREMGVSERSLHYAFEKSRNDTPATWIRTYRLNRAHRALRSAHPGPGVIKGIAIENSFTQLSHFAGLYRRFFGELPSETLQRG